jgi:hypothetical protein
MARIFLAAIFVALVAGLAAFVAAAAGRSAGNAVRDMNMTNGLNKIAFAALLILMLGISTGWLGGV